MDGYALVVIGTALGFAFVAIVALGSRWLFPKYQELTEKHNTKH